jgi:Fis family transcriptional regulator, factor for inversion stimulation protein
MSLIDDLIPATNAQHALADDSFGEQPLLRDSVQMALNNYFARLEGQNVTALYDMVLQEVEMPLLETVMDYVKGNQSKAARLLGLNRGTLRKKLKTYGLE